MKTLLTSLILFLGLNLQAQISTTRMGDIYIGKSKATIEKAIGQKINLIETNNYSGQTIQVKHKGITYELTFANRNINDEPAIILRELATESTKIKTLSGMGVGNTLDDLWKTYKDYRIGLYSEWDNETLRDSETDQFFQIFDYDQNTILQFMLKNEKVYKVSILLDEGC